MSAKRKNNPEQPELPIEGLPANAEAKKPETGNGATGNGNGATKRKAGRNEEAHVLAEPVEVPQHPFVPGKIELQLHRRVNRNFLDYASYVIRDRAIPNLADGLKPVQRR